MNPPVSGDYFGWETPHGPLSVRLSAVAALVPVVDATGASHALVLDVPGSLRIPIPDDQIPALLARMGWKKAEI